MHGHEQAHQSDRTGSEHGDALRIAQVDLPPGVHGVRQGLDERCALPAHLGREVVHRRHRDDDVLGESSAQVHTEELALPAELEVPATAQVALAAAEQRVDHHAAAVRRLAGELVSHHQRRPAETDAAEAVQLAAADPAGTDPDRQPAVRHGGSRDVLQLHGSSAGEHQRAHGLVGDGHRAPSATTSISTRMPSSCEPPVVRTG